MDGHSTSRCPQCGATMPGVHGADLCGKCWSKHRPPPPRDNADVGEMALAMRDLAEELDLHEIVKEIDNARQGNQN